MNHLTNKTHVIITRSGDYWVTEKQGDMAMELKVDSPNSYFKVDGNKISCSSIDSVLTAASYDDLNKKRRGATYCKYGYWHEKYEQCAHHLMAQLRI